MTETMVSSGTMTNRIDRLVAHGLVRRAADPKDRRMVRVRLTDAGLHTVDAAMTDLLRIEAEVMQALPRAEQERLAGLLRHLLRSEERRVGKEVGAGWPVVHCTIRRVRHVSDD